MREQTAYGAVLDGSYYSCAIGAAKPSAAFFEHIVTDLGLVPGQLLLLDDQPQNVAGARSAGLDAEQWTYDEGVTRLCDILDAHGIRLTGPGDVPRR
ncbi:MAG: haloacid dehalogenase, partial [Dermatophilaceae bacterium]